MTDAPIACAVYRSNRKEGMYLYVLRVDAPFAGLPDALMQQFGTASHVLDLDLTPERTLARVRAIDVIQALRRQGFYLQMPPGDPLPES